MRRGEVWLINLDPTVGSEIKKTRPAIIVSDDAIGVLPLKVIVPVTDWKDRYGIAPWMVKVEPDGDNGLSKRSAADAFQIRSVSEQRFARRVGHVGSATMKAIEDAILAVASIER